MTIRQVKTSLAHRGYSLVKVGYPLFALAFIDLFFSSTWFDTDISWLGLPLIIAVLIASHIFLLFLETDRAAKLYFFLLKGKPPALYLNWLEITTDGGDQNGGQDTSIRLGLRRLKLSCVDELHLTIWGNLIFKSRALSGSKIIDGKETLAADEVFKVPFGIVSSKEQREFVELAKSVRPDIVIGKLLEKKMSTKLVKGEDYIQALGAAFLMFVLLDLGYSMCNYLEMLKHYHLAQVVARAETSSKEEREKNLKDSMRDYEMAEKMLQSPPGISLVKQTILQRGLATATIYQAKAEACWFLDKKEEAIESMEKAIEYYPKSLHMHLELARWLASDGKLKQARKIISDMADERQDALLPRLYMMVLSQKAGDNDRAKRYYEIYSDKFDLEVFGEEPWWPPGSGNRYLQDSWSRDDVHYLLDAILLDKK